MLLLGESGTGKEVLAQGLHAASKRSGKFVAINCAAIPETLLESELFGYEKGAFTGAAKTTLGKIETAHGGTLMLDEIGDLPHSLQAKLLRFLQERTIERLGGRQEVPVDVRVVGATHQDLRAQIKAGQFREDLYYRLAEIVVTIPPLRERNGDAVLLAHAFLRRFAQEQRRGNLTLSEDAIRAIEAHAWPGNVRELLNAIKRAAIMADGARVTAEDIGLAVPDSRRRRAGGQRHRPAHRARAGRTPGHRHRAGAHQRQRGARLRTARREPADAVRPDAAAGDQVMRRRRTPRRPMPTMETMMNTTSTDPARRRCWPAPSCWPPAAAAAARGRALASAEAYIEKQDYAAAVIQLKSALQKNANNAEARQLLGRSLLETGDAKAAAIELRKALELGAKPSEVQPLLAKAMLAQGQARPVVQEFAAVTLDDPEASADLKTTVATAYAALGERDKARETVLPALEASPQHADAQLLHARILAARRRHRRRAGAGGGGAGRQRQAPGRAAVQGRPAALRPA